MMPTRFWPGALIAISMWLTASAAQAHPHVWVTMMTELLYAPDGSAIAVRQAWTFDDMYSAFAATGLQAKTKGQFTREELAPLAQENVESLKDFDYFTSPRSMANGRRTLSILQSTTGLTMIPRKRCSRCTLRCH
jgi:ABC-type uncharacterized transport system substrate-binding protein